jgi:hypothetical protein
LWHRSCCTKFLMTLRSATSTTSSTLVRERNLHVRSGMLLTRVNSTNVLDEGLRIGEIGRQMNSKVKLVEIGVYRK